MTCPRRENAPNCLSQTQKHQRVLTLHNIWYVDTYMTHNEGIWHVSAELDRLRALHRNASSIFTSKSTLWFSHSIECLSLLSAFKLKTTKLSACFVESGLITIPLLPVERAGIAATLHVGEMRDTWLASLPRGALYRSIELNSCQSQSIVEKQPEYLFWLFFKWGCYLVFQCLLKQQR